MRIYCNGKEYNSNAAICRRMTYLEERVNLRPEQKDELEYLGYALREKVCREHPHIESFTRWKYPGYEKRSNISLENWDHAILSCGKRFAVMALVNGENHYRVGVFKTIEEATEVMKLQIEFLEQAKKDGRAKAAFVLSRPA